MNELDRRTFMQGSIVGLAGTAAAGWGLKRGANDDIRMAIIGIRGKGGQHIHVFHRLPGVRVVALCDPDKKVLANRAEWLTKQGCKVDTYTDVRKLLEDKSIDAVAIATPNHWHSLITIWACQAGKDVYVEKPPCHNLFEARKMVEAARKYNRIVQVGTQNRSDTGLRPAMDYIHSGDLGPVKYVHGFCYKRRKSIGRVSGPQPIPGWIDYDLWTGPAPLVPLRRKSLHYDWHWQWPTGNGDIGNQGPHELDACMWAIQKVELPKRVIAIGGRLGYVDDAETPNTVVAVYDFKPAPIIFEVRGLAHSKDPRSPMDHYRGKRIGIVVFCEGGYFAGGRGGGMVYDNSGKKIKKFPGDGGGKHQLNFIEAVRSRKIEHLRADVKQGVTTTSLAHLANISYRLGTLAPQDAVKAAVKDFPRGTDAVGRMFEHLALNEVDLKRTPLAIGPWLDVDPETWTFKGAEKYGLARWANELTTRSYREPFVVPDKV